jgi:hypothetical protein
MQQTRIQHALKINRSCAPLMAGVRLYLLKGVLMHQREIAR